MLRAIVVMTWRTTPAMRHATRELLGKNVDFVTPSDYAVCLHEAGHACSALLHGVQPEFMEFSTDPNSRWLARARVTPNTDDQRKKIACGAFAVEYYLYKSQCLVDDAGIGITKEDFYKIAILDNASHDKCSFFNRNLSPNQCWSKREDRQFIAAGKLLASTLPIKCVIALAKAMLDEKKLDRKRIAQISKQYI